MKLDVKIEVLQELLNKEHMIIKQGVSLNAIHVDEIKQMLEQAIQEKIERDKKQGSKFKGVF